MDEGVKKEEKPGPQVTLRCPDCGHDFDPKGSIDRHTFYECPRCTYEFSLGHAVH